MSENLNAFRIWREPSHVLLALGMSKQSARSSVRFSLGAENTVVSATTLSPVYVTHV